MSTKKRVENHNDYKNYVKIVKNKFIEKFHAIDARVHDSNVIEPIIDEDKDKDLFHDAGYEFKDDIPFELTALSFKF